MKRLPSFLLGLVIGGAAVFVGLKYHVVRAADGWHLIPKGQATLQETYVDIRSFGATQWADHPALAADILKSDQGQLVEQSVRQGIRQSLNNLVDRLPGS